MYDLIRESTVGELLNRLSGGRYLPYPDQRPDFEIPERYRAASSSEPASCSSSTFEKRHQPTSDSSTPAEVELTSCNTEKDKPERDSLEWSSQALTRVPSRDRDRDPTALIEKPLPAHGPQLEITDTMATVTVDVEAAVDVLDEALEKTDLEAQAEYGDFILVDWYSASDPENPKNWSFRKRSFVMFEICLLT